MNFDSPIGIIELGNVDIKCLIFKINQDNTSEILSTSIGPSEGIHNGVIVNLKKASSAIRFCIGDAEKKSEILLKKIHVIVEQPEFLCTKFSKSRKIDGSKIQKEDIDFLLKEAKKQLILNDERQSIIHIFNHNYVVDGKTFIEEPIDVYADYLSHEMTFVTMPKNNLNNLRQAFIDCDIEVERFISTTFALGVELLNENEFQFGSVLLDIGFEKVSLGLFKNFALVHSITFPIGINHLTKDISKVCSLSLAESENIKNNINFTFKDNNEMFDENDYLKNSFFIDSSFRKISKSLILDVAKARLDEIFKIIKKQLLVNKLNSKFTTNFFIVGGGSNLLNLENYCSNIFKSKVKKLNKIYKEKEGNYKKKLSACLGALKIVKDGWETEAIPEPVGKNGQKLSFFERIFKNKL